MPILDDIRNAMTTGGNLVLQLEPMIDRVSSGSVLVYLSYTDTGAVRVDLKGPGEPAPILWLPWRQGLLTRLPPHSIAASAPGTLFLTYYLSGCKVFAIRGGPVWHIDAPIDVTEFWPEILQDEWVEDNWLPGTAQDVAYLHRAGQSADLWDLSAYLAGGAPTTYGAGNIGQAIVGGIVNGNGELDLYYQASPWAALDYTKQDMTKK